MDRSPGNMPIYDYYCEKCDKDFEIVKSIKSYDGKDKCPYCKNIGQRLLSTVTFYGEKVETPEYNIGLGTVVKNSQHRKELAADVNFGVDAQVLAAARQQGYTAKERKRCVD